jgi:hypothetical protein
MGTRIEVYLTHDLPRFDDVGAVLERLEATLPAARAVGEYWRSANFGGSDNDRWELEAWGGSFPDMREFCGPGVLWLSVTRTAARVHTGARWRGFLSIEPLRRAHLAALRAIAHALGSAEMVICSDAREDVAEVFLDGGTQAECAAMLRATLGPPQPSIEMVTPEIVAETERGVPQVWYVDRVPAAE